MTSIQAELGIIERDFTEQVSAASSSEELQQVKVAFLGKRRRNPDFKELGSFRLRPPAAGQVANPADRIEAVIEDKRARLDEIELRPPSARPWSTGPFPHGRSGGGVHPVAHSPMT